jgi:hypothetical protein
LDSAVNEVIRTGIEPREQLGNGRPVSRHASALSWASACSRSRSVEALQPLAALIRILPTSATATRQSRSPRRIA